MQGGPLAGIRVIDLTTVVLGPFATQMLGDMGADVIKVEAPDGDNCRWIGPQPQRGHGLLLRHAQPQQAQRGAGPEAPRGDARRCCGWSMAPTCSCTTCASAPRNGSGSAMPPCRRAIRGWSMPARPASARAAASRSIPAFDDLIQGMSGMAALNAGPDGAPRYVPSVLVDKLTGQMLASMIGMALFHRERTGQGQEVHVPMLETMLSFLLVEHMWGAVFDQPELGLGYPRMLTPHRRPYATKDGYISVIAVSDAHWSRLFEAMGRASLIEDPRFATIAARSDNVDALYAVLTEGMRERTTAEWLATAARARHSLRAGQYAATICWTTTTCEKPEFFQRMRHPLDGDVTITAIPARFSAIAAVGATAVAGARRTYRGGAARDRLRRARDPGDHARLKPPACPPAAT